MSRYMLVFVGMSRYYIIARQCQQTTTKKQFRFVKGGYALNPGNKNTLFQQQNCLGDVGIRTPVSSITGDTVYY